MTMTVRRLAQTPGLGLSLIAGRDGGDRSIGWAHAIELEDPTPYLSGGELVMTTGMNVGDTADRQFEYLARLSSAGVAALAFDTGTTHPAVPAGIIAAGDALGLPVLSVPPQTPFIAISRAIIDEVTADQLRSVQRVVDQQEVLARETLRNGIPAVVAALSKLLSATVVVIDVDGNALAASGSETDHVCALGAGLIEDSANRRTKHASRVVADGSGYCTLQALKAAQPLRGYLAVKTNEPLSPTERLLVSHAVSLISIEMGKPAKILDAEHRLRVATTAGLIADPPTIDHAVLRYFRFDPDEDISVVALTGTGPSLTAETHALRVLESRHSRYLICSGAGELIVILPAAESAAAPLLVTEVGAQLQKRVRGGLSKPATFGNIATAVNQARTAALIGNSDDAFQTYAEIGLFDVILGGRSADELRLIAEPVAPLVDQDTSPNGTGDGLLTTLESYLRHNGHLEGAAAELGIHRHTMRNRVAKIAQLTRRDLQSPDVRAQLLLAIRARELLRIDRPD
ncbi:PucR family transcriptional regulator ligand-binding domain-containing protein [Mycolicibacterium farcinogenes]|uniref:PucR family transcriptional regulator n=1 Tax=Mycolicibacterium farcinogenes TaxID=1802 RepID=UPI001C8E2ECC|nr:PucR family transcriptional regulator [Mycolicibacterium farcinogenes]QZH57881.1 PucR family transcriptional regulator ligand-binding domain-containing protein [Mycolicibacterium farcinogenes]